MAKIADIKSIIANMTAQSVPANTTTTGAIQYHVKATTTAAKPEVHDVAPIQSPTYTVQPVVTNNKEEAKVPATDSTTSVINSAEYSKPSVSSNAVSTAISLLVKDKDYGYVSGISGAILFKTGAIKIIRHFNLRVQESLLDKAVDIEHGYIGYTIKVSLVDEDGCIVTEAIASANSMEKKFAKNGLGGDSMLPSIAAKRALINAAKFLINR